MTERPRAVALRMPDWRDALETLRGALPDERQRRAPLRGATAAELDALAARLGAALPEPVRRLYEQVNGLDWRDVRFFSIAEILDEALQKQLRKALNAGGEIEDGHLFFFASRHQDIGAVLGVREGAAFVANVASGGVTLASADRAIESVVNAPLAS